MKILTRFESAWNGERYVSVSEESYEYAGPIARCDLGGGSTTTTVVQPATPAPPTPEETEANKLTLEQLRRQNAIMEQYFPVQQQQVALSQQSMEALLKQQQADAARQEKMDALMPPELQAERAAKTFQQEQDLRDLSNTVLQAQMKQIQEGGKPTPEQISSIDEAVAAEKAISESDIDRYLSDSLKQINEEVAASMGLRPSDTPVLRLSERVGAEAVRQKGQVSSRLAQTAARARVDLPLAQASLAANIATNSTQIADSAARFRQELEQRAADNRARLFQAPALGGMQLGGSAQNYSSTLAGLRFNTAGRETTTTTDNELGLGQIGQAAGGIGSLLYGGARLFGPAAGVAIL